MSNLYGDLSEVYDAMYQTFIDYDEEYRFYKGILDEFSCLSVVELGCGTGRLAAKFEKVGFEYYGIDNSEEMIEIAERRSSAQFGVDDMCYFTMPHRSFAVILTARTVSYLLTNKDMRNMLASAYKASYPAGLICFDFIDANRFIPTIKPDKAVMHEADFGARKFRRESFWKINDAQSWLFDWKSVYYEMAENGDWPKIGEDNSTIRAFTKDEITLFLTLSGYNVVRFIDRPSYAFDTFVVVAEKSMENYFS